ncbi:MAG: tripartite tricarboxylate transporter TctB family protein [Thermomicrobiales bacterium]
MNDTDRDQRLSLLAELVLAGGVVALGAVVIWQTTNIRLTPINSRVGPRVIPYIVGSGLVITGIWLAIDILRGNVATAGGSEDDEDADPTLPTDWFTVGLIGASLVAYLYLIERAGFVIASTVLFSGSAFAMGSRRILRDVTIGLLLSTVIFFVFTDGLSLRLPEGLLPLNDVF